MNQYTPRYYLITLNTGEQDPIEDSVGKDDFINRYLPHITFTNKNGKRIPLITENVKGYEEITREQYEELDNLKNYPPLPEH